MSAPLPILVATSGAEMLVWLVVAVIWLIFQGLASASKRKPPPGPPTPSGPPERPQERPPGEELRDLIETLTGQRPDLHETKAEDEDEEEAPVFQRPPPPRPPVRPVEPPRRTTARPAKPPPARGAIPPPGPGAAPELPAMPAAAAASPAVTVPPAPAREALRLAPLMRMQWPRSPLGNLSLTTATRAGQPTPLHRRLRGRSALRQAMVSRIVLGRPLGD